MAVEQLPVRMREFASYLDGLLARLDPRGGWSGVFWQRDPEGMRACLDGREVPPWDVVEALLRDLGAAYGPAAAAAERDRARALHTAALTAYDARPGARDALVDRLDVMLRERRYAAERQAGLSRLLSAPATGEEAEALRLDLAWARDDHDRATARCAELRTRIAELDRRAATGGRAAPGAEGAHTHGPAGVGGGGDVRTEGERGGGAGYGEVERGEGAGYGERAEGVGYGAGERAEGAGYGERAEGVGYGAGERGGRVGYGQGGAGAGAGGGVRAGVSGSGGPGAKARRRRRGSARFAGMAEDEGAAPVVVPREPPPPAAVDGRRAPRGARFAGAGEAGEPVTPAGAAVQAAAVDEDAGAAVGEAVSRLARLRAEGRSGEAHVLLVEATRWPPGRLPLLADALHRAGLAADWATLLWEAAALPAERLVAAADALAAAGREGDGRQMLRQGVARPADQIGAAVLRLDGEGRHREVRALLGAYVRVRVPEEAARCAAAGPGRLVPLLLEAARGVSDERHWDLVHALRVAGYTM
ncbi:hypothetical protein [Streptomyces sp. NPDC013455]|uniref:hypothetical protein n=1 Tax=Streptomyces sp. NPDC013455 TaxID=3155605 RepID=UPI003405F3E8